MDSRIRRTSGHTADSSVLVKVHVMHDHHNRLHFSFCKETMMTSLSKPQLPILTSLCSAVNSSGHTDLEGSLFRTLPVSQLQFVSEPKTTSLCKFRCREIERTCVGNDGDLSLPNWGHFTHVAKSKANFLSGKTTTRKKNLLLTSIVK